MKTRRDRARELEEQNRRILLTHGKKSGPLKPEAREFWELVFKHIEEIVDERIEAALERRDDEASSYRNEQMERTSCESE